MMNKKSLIDRIKWEAYKQFSKMFIAQLQIISNLNN